MPINVELNTMTKDSLVNMLIRLDTAAFRRSGLIESNQYKHEPLKFRIRLKKVYDKLDKNDIIELLKIRLNK